MTEAQHEEIVLTGEKTYYGIETTATSEKKDKEENKIIKEIIVELHKEFLDEESTLESCILCSHNYIDKNGFYNCGLENFHVCCGGVNCKDFEISSYVKASFEKIKNLKEQIENEKIKNVKMKRCEICKYQGFKGCNYHSLWAKDCKENNMKLFELKELKER